MRAICEELLKYITDAIYQDMTDTEINRRIEVVADNNEITNSEYFEIYEQATRIYGSLV